MSKQDRIDFYKQQIDLENTIHDKAEKTVINLPNVLIREMIMGIALDSKKHAALLKSLVGLHTKTTPSMPEDISFEEKKISQNISRWKNKLLRLIETFLNRFKMKQKKFSSELSSMMKSNITVS